MEDTAVAAEAVASVAAFGDAAFVADSVVDSVADEADSVVVVVDSVAGPVEDEDTEADSVAVAVDSRVAERAARSLQLGINVS